MPLTLGAAQLIIWPLLYRILSCTVSSVGRYLFGLRRLRQRFGVAGFTCHVIQYVSFRMSEMEEHF